MNQRKKNNQGSTIIIVLLMSSFIMIIATAITITTLTTLKMRMAGRESKKTFYTSEEAVDEVYAALGKVSIESFNKAYEQELSKIRLQTTIIAGNPISNSYIDNNTANIQLREAYTMQLLKNLNILGEEGEERYAALLELQSKQDGASKVSLLLTDNKKNLRPDLYDKINAADNFKKEAKKYLEPSNIEITSVDSVEVIMKTTDKEQGETGYNLYSVEFKNCVVKYETSAGYYSYITFNGTVGMPDVPIDFVDNDINGTLNFSEYCLIGNVGVDINSKADITGSAYAGYMDGFTVLSDNVNFSGKNLICAGDINVGGTFNISNANVYTEGIKVGKKTGFSYKNTKLEKGASNYDAKSGTLNISGSEVYVQDDMEINGDSSNANFSDGKYVGYGSELASTNAVGKPNYSSSLIINGVNSRIGFSGTNVSLSGRAFINYSNNFSAKLQKKEGDYSYLSTGEDLSVDVNQEIYMIPAELITKGTNPYYTAGFDTPEDFECSITEDNFFGYSLLANNAKTGKMYTTRNSEVDVYDADGKWVRTKYYTYYYFNFKDEASLKKYYSIISDSSGDAYRSYLGKDPSTDKLWRSMNNYYKSYTETAGSSIDVSGASAYTSYLETLVKGESTSSYKVLYDDKASRFSAYLALLMKLKDDSANYNNAMVENEITDFKKYLETARGSGKGIYYNFINPEGLDKIVEKFSGTYHTTALDNGNFHMVAIKNDGSTYTVPDDYKDGIIVSSGSVKITHDFNGIIIAAKDVIVDNSEGITIKNNYSMNDIVSYIQSANKSYNGEFFYYKDIFTYWNSKTPNAELGTLKLSDMTYKDMVKFSEWRKYEDSQVQTEAATN